MRSFKVLFMMMLSAAVLVGCSKKKPAADAGNDTDTTTSETTGINFDALATDMCDCASGMLANLKKMEALTTAGDTDGITALSTEMGVDSDKFETCVTALQAKYPGVEGDAGNEAKAEAALVKGCPDLAKVIGAGSDE